MKIFNIQYTQILRITIYLDELSLVVLVVGSCLKWMVTCILKVAAVLI